MPIEMVRISELPLHEGDFEAVGVADGKTVRAKMALSQLVAQAKAGLVTVAQLNEEIQLQNAVMDEEKAQRIAADNALTHALGVVESRVEAHCKARVKKAKAEAIQEAWDRHQPLLAQQFNSLRGAIDGVKSTAEASQSAAQQNSENFEQNVRELHETFEDIYGKLAQQSNDIEAIKSYLGI